MITTERLITIKQNIDEILPDHVYFYKNKNIKANRYMSKQKLIYFVDKLIEESKKDDEGRRTNEG